MIHFTFDGKTVEAFEGDTIGSALYAAGQRTFSRSFKYHRRRGLMCVAGQCPNCLCAVDGAPGARACTEPVREGIKVEHLNAEPSLEFDVMEATDRLGGPFMPPGFYYKTFIRPRKLWPLYEKVLRNAAGLGKLRKHQEDREWRTEYRRRHADVLVVGGGVAGLSAAIAAARLGADVVLVDEGPEPGGRLLADRRDGSDRAARRRGARGRRRDPRRGPRRWATSTAWSRSGRATPCTRSAPRRHVFATGTIEQPLVFAGNDLPGVMLSDGARRLGALYAVRPGTRAVIATTSDRGLDAAVALRGDRRRDRRRRRPAAGWPGPAAETLRSLGVEVLAGHTVSRRVAARPSSGRCSRRSGPTEGERAFDCDLVVVSGGVARRPRCCCRPAARPTMTSAAATSPSPRSPRACCAAGELTGAEGFEAICAVRRARRLRGRARRSASATRPRARPPPSGRPSSTRPASRRGSPCRRRSAATGAASASPASART